MRVTYSNDELVFVCEDVPSLHAADQRFFATYGYKPNYTIRTIVERTENNFTRELYNLLRHHYGWNKCERLAVKMQQANINISTLKLINKILDGEE